LSGQNLSSQDEVRNALRRTWHAFFAQFPRLRKVQQASILPILRGDNVLVNSPTASGKTEAIVAPLLERLMSQGLGCNLSFMIVAPTKALCNDLHRRLHRSFSVLGLKLDIKTGDAPSLNAAKPPFALITTPESLDSLLSRRPVVLRDLRAVIVDEVHLLAQSARGDQLQCLLRRLSKVAEHPLQICAASATMPEIARIARTFLGIEVEIIQISSAAREIRAEFVECYSQSDVGAEISRLILSNSRCKALVFANSRAQVEGLVSELSSSPRMATKVFAHHGSMSKDERLRSEKQFLRSQNAVCIATSTLELGIDIGDVNRTVLVGAPPNVSSLIQRIGRGNRQSKTIEVSCIYEDDFERLRFEHLIECAQREEIFPDPVAFRPTTLVQQALSVLFQNPKRWVSPGVLYERISDEARELYDVDDCYALLREMASASLLREVAKRRFVAEDKAEFLYDRGLMHSMIEDKGETDVVDALTGRTIGSVRLAGHSKRAISMGLKPTLSLAGKSREVAYFKEDKLYVQAGSASKNAQFVSHEPPRYSLALARHFAQYLGQEDGIIELHEDDSQILVVQHFLGSIGAVLLSEYLQAHGAELVPKSTTAFHFALKQAPAIERLPPKDELLQQFSYIIHEKSKLMAKYLQIGPYSAFIPQGMLLRWLRASIRLEDYAEVLAGAQLL